MSKVGSGNRNLDRLPSTSCVNDLLENASMTFTICIPTMNVPGRALMEVGGFRIDASSVEDTQVIAKMILAGYKVP
jgi:hypothetical protein